MLPPLPLPRRVLPWVLAAFSVLAGGWALYTGERVLLGLSVLGLFVALMSLFGPGHEERDKNEKRRKR